jgi:hypothetical protein
MSLVKGIVPKRLGGEQSPLIRAGAVGAVAGTVADLLEERELRALAGSPLRSTPQLASLPSGAVGVIVSPGADTTPRYFRSGSRIRDTRSSGARRVSVPSVGRAVTGSSPVAPIAI